MVLSLPAELEQFVQHQVASGRYRSVDDVVQAGLSLLKERQQKLDELRAEIQIGLDELDRGEGVPLDMAAIKARVRQRLAADGPSA